MIIGLLFILIFFIFFQILGQILPRKKNLVSNMNANYFFLNSHFSLKEQIEAESAYFSEDILFEDLKKMFIYLQSINLRNLYQSSKSLH